MPSKALTDLRKSFHSLGSAERATGALRFFKTGPGDYGEGDQFLGLSVPETRSFLPSSDTLSEADMLNLLHSKWHEERLYALLVLVRRFAKAKKNTATQEWIVGTYLANTLSINNWDLVDSSASYILGEWLFSRDRAILYSLASSTWLWDQRIAVIATHAFIRNDDYTDTLRLCAQFLTHKHDLIHKACGWMLREVGKRSEKSLLPFLDAHASAMPRTMLRYAIEKLNADKRRHYLDSKAPKL